MHLRSLLEQEDREKARFPVKSAWESRAADLDWWVQMTAKSDPLNFVVYSARMSYMGWQG